MTSQTSADRTRELMMFPPCARGDHDALWAALDLGAAPSSRDQIVALTMLEVARVGPAAFNTRTVCAELGLTHPVIQYHFGSRDALIAEAAHRIYVRYVDKVEAAVDAAPRTPVDRLRAALTAGVALAREIRGWGAVLNYFPLYSESVAEVVAERFQDQHTRQYERNMSLLLQLVVDVWQDTVTAPLLTEDTSAAGAEALSVLAGHEAMAAFARLGFAVHGLAVWRAGHIAARHESDEQYRSAEAIADAITSRTIEDLIREAVAVRPRMSPPVLTSREKATTPWRPQPVIS